MISILTLTRTSVHFSGACMLIRASYLLMCHSVPASSTNKFVKVVEVSGDVKNDEMLTKCSIFIVTQIHLSFDNAAEYNRAW